MKKILLLCALCLLSTPSVSAEKTCVGGSLITANSASDASKGIDCGTDNMYCNEQSYCKSNKPMNWWSANAWCQSQNRELVELNQACPNFAGDTCPNLKGTGSGWVWTKTPSGNNAYTVYLNYGDSSSLNRTSTYGYALCQ